MRRFIAVGILVVTAAISAPATLARFTSTGDADATFGTGTVLPPTGLTASVAGTTVTLDWTPSASAAAEGYELLRSATSGSGFAVVTTVTPGGATSTTDAPGGGTWYYVLRTTLQHWHSAASNEAAAPVALGATGFHACTSSTADSGGDDNGFQSNPGSACVEDGGYAQDTDTGTNTTLSCTNAGKDRHRFGGFALGLPATATSIDGIELALVAGMNNNGGTSYLCVQLSPDGGATWTAMTQVSLTGSALATYRAGGPADTWGLPWTPAQLASGTFLVRVISVSSQPNKAFRLDAVSAQVHFTP